LTVDVLIVGHLTKVETVTVDALIADTDSGLVTDPVALIVVLPRDVLSVIPVPARRLPDMSPVIVLELILQQLIMLIFELELLCVHVFNVSARRAIVYPPKLVINVLVS
jgi:hypothetical protein